MMLVLLLQHPLLRDLGAEEYEVREAATVALAQMGPDIAEPILREALASRDPEVRARVVAILWGPIPTASLGGVRTRVIGVLDSDDDERAFNIPIRFLDPDAEPAESPSYGVHLFVEPIHDERVAGWLRDLASNQHEVRERATEQLSACCEHVKPALEIAAASLDREVGYRARQLLAQRLYWRHQEIIDRYFWGEFGDPNSYGPQTGH